MRTHVRTGLKAGTICGAQVVPITSAPVASAWLRRWLTTARLAKAQLCHALYQLGSKCVARGMSEGWTFGCKRLYKSMLDIMYTFHIPLSGYPNIPFAIYLV